MRMGYCILFFIIIGSIGFSSVGHAALTAVSGRQTAGTSPMLTAVPADGNPALVAVSLNHGFPIWYEDENLLQLTLCTDTALEVAPDVVVNPCDFEAPQINAPPSFPGNFGEAAYWSAVSAGTYQSSDGTLNAVLLVLAHDAGFADEGPTADGRQVVSSRIRLRIDLPVAGNYRITHPYGSREYDITIPGRRAINQTRDLGDDDAQNFLLSMGDGPVPVEPFPFIPSENVGIVNSDGAGIGPWLVPANPHGGVFDVNAPATFRGGPITVDGVTYIGLPSAPNALNPLIPLDIFQPVVGSTFVPDGETEPANYFRIELLNPPAGFELNPANSTDPQVVQFDGFQITGKVFNPDANQAPLAPADSAATAIDQPLLIDVTANDSDPAGIGNAHGLDIQALALVDPNRLVEPLYFAWPPFGMPQLTPTQTTLRGGSVRRVNNISTGTARFFYTPPTGFTGIDSFEYLLQDSGGLISEPALVTVTVEELAIDRADFRVKTGKWRATGTSSDSTANTVTLFAGSRAVLNGDAVVPAVETEALGNAGLRIHSGGIDYLLRLDPLPAGTVTDVRIELGNPGDNGPVLFFLFFDLFDGVFTGSFGGTLGVNDLFLWPTLGISSFADAVTAIHEGRAYINVRTLDNPAGEIRGQLFQPMIGTAQVEENGVWNFNGRSGEVPGILPALRVQSENGITGDDVFLRLR